MKMIVGETAWDVRLIDQAKSVDNPRRRIVLVTRDGYMSANFEYRSISHISF